MPGFFGRALSQVPGILNNLAQNYAGPGFSEAAQGTSSLLKSSNRKGIFKRRNQTPPSSMTGIDTGPTRPVGGAGYGTMGNTGIIGGSVPNFGMNMGMNPGVMPNTGLWSNYLRMYPTMS